MGREELKLATCREQAWRNTILDNLQTALTHATFRHGQVSSWHLMFACHHATCLKRLSPALSAKSQTQPANLNCSVYCLEAEVTEVLGTVSV